MRTKIDQKTTYQNGLIFYSYPCKFEDTCANYSSALTLPKKPGNPLNPCTHGGGYGHRCYRVLHTKALEALQ